MKSKTKEPVCIHGQSTGAPCRHCDSDAKMITQLHRYQIALRRVAYQEECNPRQVAQEILKEYGQ